MLNRIRRNTRTVVVALVLAAAVPNAGFAHGLDTYWAIPSPMQGPMYGIRYCWTFVTALDGAVDVVCERSLVTRPCIAQGILPGSFYLCSRIVPATPKKQILFRRLFDRGF
jgi:hypothetical protein